MGGRRNRGLLAAAVGIVAAVAIPIAAPYIASAIGASGVVGSTLVGAALGAGAGAVSGSITGNMGRGALTGAAGGAVGGFFGGGGLNTVSNALFGPAPEVASVLPGTVTGPEVTALEATYQPGTIVAEALPPPPGVSVAAPSAPEYVAAMPSAAGAPSGGLMAPNAGVITSEALSAPPGVIAAPQVPVPAEIGVQPLPVSVAEAAPFTGYPTTFAAGSPGAAPGPVAGAAGPAGPVAAPKPTTFGERFMASMTGGGPSLFSAEGAGRAVGSLLTPSGIAGVGQLAMTMYNRPPQDLTPEERDYVRETAELAGTNRALFEERVSAARRLLQQGTPNPEQVYAQARLAAERGALEGTSRTEADLRRARIRGTEIGTLAAAGEGARATEATRAGLAAMPTTAPIGPAGLAMPAFRDVEERRRQYASDLSRSIGGIAGAFSGTRDKSSLFGSIA